MFIAVVNRADLTSRFLSMKLFLYFNLLMRYLKLLIRDIGVWFFPPYDTLGFGIRVILILKNKLQEFHPHYFFEVSEQGWFYFLNIW